MAPNEIWLVDVGPSGLANITVNEGLLGIQATTTLGNAANTVTVNSGASLAFWGNSTNILNKVLSMSSGRVYNGNGSNTFLGATTLASSSCPRSSGRTTPGPRSNAARPRWSSWSGLR